jgi:hypothetical protein
VTDKPWRRISANGVNISVTYIVDGCHQRMASSARQ